MSTIIGVVQKFVSSRRTLMIAGIILLSASLVAIYVDIMMAQIIAPPALRVLDFFWRTFHWLNG